MPYIKPATISIVPSSHRNGGLLSDDQRMILPYLLTHKTYAAAAKACGLVPQTVYQWMDRCPAFRAAVKDFQRIIDSECYQRLKAEKVKNIEKLVEIREGDDARLALMAAGGLLEQERKERELQLLEEANRLLSDQQKGSRRMETIDAAV